MIAQPEGVYSALFNKDQSMLTFDGVVPDGFSTQPYTAERIPIPGIGGRLRGLRAGKGLSLSAVAAKTGFTKSALSKAERGVTDAYFHNVARVYEFLRRRDPSRPELGHAALYLAFSKPSVAVEPGEQSLLLLPPDDGYHLVASEWFRNIREDLGLTLGGAALHLDVDPASVAGFEEGVHHSLPRTVAEYFGGLPKAGRLHVEYCGIWQPGTDGPPPPEASA